MNSQDIFESEFFDMNDQPTVKNQFLICFIFDGRECSARVFADTLEDAKNQIKKIGGILQ